jgi:replicative DNA helicase
MAEAAGDLSRLPIRIDDTSGVTVEAVCRQARMMHERGQCGCVVVDYLQLLAGSGGSGAQRHEDVAHMSRQLKALSKDLAIPVIAVSQLNRASEQRKGGEPMLSDLRESGQIEQDAAVIMFPHRPSIHDDRMPKHQAFVIVAKNRYGDTGRVEVEWQGKESRFVPLGERLANPPPPTHGGDYGNFRRPSAPPRPPPMPGPPLMPGSPPMPTPDYD